MALKRDVTYSGRFNAASPEHPQGEFKNRTSPTSEDGSYLEQQWLNDWDGFFGSLLAENDIDPDGNADEVGASQYFEGMLRLREVTPRNNDWNGYLDPEHQSSLPAPNGYPGNSGGGEVPYGSNKEISYGIYAGASGSTVSSDSDGWIFTNSIYREYRYTTEQLVNIDVNTVSIYIKGQDGSEHFVTNATNGVTVTKPDAETLRVEITDAIFATLGITKLWRWFDTERVGRVVEKSPENLKSTIKTLLNGSRTKKDVTGSRTAGILYTNDSGADIVLYFSGSRVGAAAMDVFCQVDGKIVARYTASSVVDAPINLTVPSGSTYRITVSGVTSSTWEEFRP